MLYQFPRKYTTVNSRKKYYAEYVRGWVGRVKPHCSSVLIMKGRERGREGEGGGITGIHIMYVHTIHTHTQTLPTNHHARAHVPRDENANSLCMRCMSRSFAYVTNHACTDLPFFVRACLSTGTGTGTGRVCQKKKMCEAL